MSADEGESLVEVLFDYSYMNDTGEVEIKTGQEYYLLEKTNDEWWQVRRKDDENLESAFYVPAQYVRVIDEENDSLSPRDQEETSEGEKSIDDDARRTPPTVNADRREVEDRKPGSPRRPVSESARNNVAQTKWKHFPEREEALYANLDEFRAAANIPPVSILQDCQESNYANVSFIQGTVDPPMPEEGEYVRVLVEHLPWDIYREKETGRLFYHNRETGERMWKPPRKERPAFVNKDQKARGLLCHHTAFDFDMGPSPREIHVPPEYDEKKEDGKVFFVNRETKVKWRSTSDSSGQRYFYRVDTDDSCWELPSTEEHEQQHNGEVTKPHSQQHMLRISKAKSMYGDLDFMRQETDGATPFKASTLPPGFTYAGNSSGPLGSNPSVQGGGSTSPSYRFEDPLCGFLNKAKIAEVGRKVKKSWSQSYVVLHRSNLIFYKDQKAASHKQGSPHGKPENVISLQGARIDFNPSKAFTSRKNVIIVMAGTGSQFLLQCDDEKKIHEWLFRLKLAANDIDKEKSPPPAASPTREEKKGFTRSVSADDASLEGQVQSSTTGDKLSPVQATYFSGIRSKLLSLISRRPTQEDLVKRGIIKECVFGAHLNELCQREHSSVPLFVKKCIAAVESRGLDHDGLYRVSGNLAEIQRLRYVIDKDPNYNLEEDQWDIHVLTGSLKLFFRELQDPLFPYQLFDRFTAAIKREKNNEKRQAFRDLIATLPKSNCQTMRVLFHHLRKVIENSHENRMQTQNVAIVFGPTLMWNEADSTNIAIMTIYQSKVVEYILLEYEELFR